MLFFRDLIFSKETVNSSAVWKQYLNNENCYLSVITHFFHSHIFLQNLNTITKNLLPNGPESFFRCVISRE